MRQISRASQGVTGGRIRRPLDTRVPGRLSGAVDSLVLESLSLALGQPVRQG